MGVQISRQIEGSDQENQSSPLFDSCVKKEPEKVISTPSAPHTPS